MQGCSYRVALGALVVFGLTVVQGLTSHTAEAQRLSVQISKSSQTMRVYIGGKLRHRWAVSTGRSGYRTPSGSYRPTRLEKMWHSRKYNMSPMPHSVFFRGGYAIHGTYETKWLGRPASHGCIRLAPGNARRLFTLVRRYGAGNTRIRIR
ncbi:MAG: L,D-transpeptidase [Pseudomonadota bacterium]